MATKENLNKNPLKSKKFLALIIGMLIMAGEIAFLGEGNELPEGVKALLVSQGLALLGYLLGQAGLDVATTNAVAKQSIASLDLEALKSGKLSLVPTSPSEPPASK